MMIELLKIGVIKCCWIVGQKLEQFFKLTWKNSFWIVLFEIKLKHHRSFIEAIRRRMKRRKRRKSIIIKSIKIKLIIIEFKKLSFDV